MDPFAGLQRLSSSRSRQEVTHVCVNGIVLEPVPVKVDPIAALRDE
jgi:hypothetical protein